MGIQKEDESLLVRALGDYSNHDLLECQKNSALSTTIFTGAGTAPQVTLLEFWIQLIHL
jgi:hypothetical protein